MRFFKKLTSRPQRAKEASKEVTVSLTRKDAPPRYCVLDVEVGISDAKVHDIGALRWDGVTLHTSGPKELRDFLGDADLIVGHNILHHDLRHLLILEEENENEEVLAGREVVDTLYLSPLMFPRRPYHSLVKDDKILSGQLNNPVADCRKALDLMYAEMAQWERLPQDLRLIYSGLLRKFPEFRGFLEAVQAPEGGEPVDTLIRRHFKDRICTSQDLTALISNHPQALAYALALISADDHTSVTPPWLLRTYPMTEEILLRLCGTPCREGCAYCHHILDIHEGLQRFFGYGEFRTFDGERLQEEAVRAASEGRSLLAIFPTGGGKSLTFQLPALIGGRSVHGLTVVISPLLSLMKDQVDNLERRGIEEAVTINGMLDPLSRKEAIGRVQEGRATLLYIAPEMLRSRTIERILLERNVIRFVIDEAHCLSAWGQDFRVDYLHIGRFIHEYSKKKRLDRPVPVSCFTATAKQKVIQDIRDYFQKTAGLSLDLFASKAVRKNLRYSVIHAETDEQKYQRLRNLISISKGPSIVYVARTRQTEMIAHKLTRDGFSALPFHGKMDAEAKASNQDAFMSGKVSVMVATSAFGMGVDKKDVATVIHYDISDSLENYVQEAGRAGRDPGLQASCYVLYSDSDLDKHFTMLTQTKLSIGEIQKVWKVIRDGTRLRPQLSCSALELARFAGLDESAAGIETKIRSALSALEQAGFIQRGYNAPRVLATGITVRNMDEARERISASSLFEKREAETAARIIKSLITERYITRNQDPDAESRVDYLADILGLTTREVISAVERMRLEGILKDTQDLTGYLRDCGDSLEKSLKVLERMTVLERFLLKRLLSEDPDGDTHAPLTARTLNQEALEKGLSTSTEKDIRTILGFLSVRGYIHKMEDAAHNMDIQLTMDGEALSRRQEERAVICQAALRWLYHQRVTSPATGGEAGKARQEKAADGAVHFSLVALLIHIQGEGGKTLFGTLSHVRLEDVEEALLYLSRIGALKLEGGFMVLYNTMSILRTKDTGSMFRREHYRILDEFYRQKIQMIHIVGEYANLMVRDYDAALRFVSDYFSMDYQAFLRRYFQKDRAQEIGRCISPALHRKLFSQLSPRQMEIIEDKDSRCIVVAAGPGSGKTRVLVHKLASLLLLEDVKQEQLLMLTFSRAAATEFRERLTGLIGSAARYVEIRTFHSYCFDLLGRAGSLEEARDVVTIARKAIAEGQVEPRKTAKSVLVIDEAQDMGSEEYELVHCLMEANEQMRVIAVGDDDQGIFDFRGSDSRNMQRLLEEKGSRLFEMTENYRSSGRVVDFANAFAGGITQRMKTTPIVAVRKEAGEVRLRHHSSPHMYEPLVRELLETRREGSAAILTETNRDAAILVALLGQHSVPCRLIEGLGGLRFWNLMEVRHFIRLIEKASREPVISDEIWHQAQNQTFRRYEGSTSLPYLRQCIALFDRTHATRYLTDLRDFIFESDVEDFCDLEKADIVVSTIHRAKGREFDDVHMLLRSPEHLTDQTRRKYYVGMTRARRRLMIHTDGAFLDDLPASQFTRDTEPYGLPGQVLLQLTHRDVNLSFFEQRKALVLSLRAGIRLRYQDFTLSEPAARGPVARLSQKMQEEVQRWEADGYRVTEARIRFIVAWKPQDAPREEAERAVILPDLLLSRQEMRNDEGKGGMTGEVPGGGDRGNAPAPPCQA